MSEGAPLVPGDEGVRARMEQLQAENARLVSELAAFRADVEGLRDGLLMHSEKLHAGLKRSKDKDVKVVLFAKWGSSVFWHRKVTELLSKGATRCPRGES